MIGLGRILAEAREARSVTLEQAERETRIGQRYLLALEEEEFSAFPTRVQARGFLRVYAQYLSLDPHEILGLFPSEDSAQADDGLVHGDRLFRERDAGPAVRVPALRLRGPWQTLGAAFAAVVIVCGLIGSRCASGEEQARARMAALAGEGGDGALPVPDVREDDLPTALARLEAAGIRPLVIEVPSDRIAAGLVIRQTPPPGASVARGGDVTLIVSRGR